MRSLERRVSCFARGFFWVALVSCGATPSPIATPAPPPTVTSPPPENAMATPLSNPSVARDKTDKAFRDVASRFLAGYLARFPENATELGDHRYDDRWSDLSLAREADLRAFLTGVLRDLAAIPRDGLNDQNHVDARILEDQTQSLLFHLDEIRERETDALSYTTLLGDGLDPLVSRDFAPLAERMQSLRGRLAGVPAVVAIAKARLKNPARVNTETAVERAKGLVALCEKGLAASFAGVPEMRSDLETAAKGAAVALRDLQSFLEKDLLPRSNGSFRMGRARYEKILRFALEDEVDADELAAEAQATLVRTRGEMVDTAKELWPTLMSGPTPPSETPEQQHELVGRVLTKLADDATDPKSILAEATKLLAEATSFVREHDLVGVPDEPCRVIEMPEYRRGVAIAYCDASGPLERKQETFFAIAPAPRTWSAKRAASFYREYNRSMLVDLTVHEAMPGHYLQAMHANAFHSDVRTVFQNGAFVEGWANYGEWLMAKHGFGGPKARMQRLKMLLRVATNVLLDHGIHAGTLEEKEALAMMTVGAFQEEGEAVAKWTRARLTSGQLSTYFYGYREFMRLREATSTRPGFREREYNDGLIASGAPPMRDLRWLLERR